MTREESVWFRHRRPRGGGDAAPVFLEKEKVMKALSLGAGMLLALSGCSSSSNGSDPNSSPNGFGGATPYQPGAGGFTGPGAGGSGVPGGGGYNPGAGGYTPGAGGYNPGAGGSIVTPGAGGSIVTPGAGGSITPGAGGTTPGAGGTNPGGGGSAGAVTLVHCTQVGESSAHPVTDPCGDITSPSGTNIQLGPYGAQMDVNVGKGFENPNPNDDATCPSFVNLFAGETLSTQLLDTGPQPCTVDTPNTGNCLNYTLYSVYRPAIWPAGPIPVITWGNGTCAQPEGYGTLLRYIASYGFFVVAANSREVGSGTPITHALDFVAAANKDSTSPYYGHLDMTKVGVAGHSQGGQGAAAAAADSRIQAAILVSPFPSGSTTKPFFRQDGDQDVTGATQTSMASAINAASKAAYMLVHNPAGAAQDGYKGHLVLMLTPERVAQPFTGWFQMLLLNDANARNLFVGSNCGLCNHSTDYAYGEHGL